MPRPSKGPRIELQRPSDGRQPTFVIRDGQLTRGTGCHEHDRVGAERALAHYIIKKHDPTQALNVQDVNSIRITDVCSMEIMHIAKRKIDRTYKNQLISAIQRIGNWFANYTIGDLNGPLQERYAEERVMQPSAFRDLKLLQAAINRCVKKTKGGIQPKFSATLPEAPKSRVRYLTRDEAAKLLWTAWRERKATKLPGSKGRHTLRHIARYILIGIYTGSRNGDICNASLIPAIDRGYVDLDRGIFKRKPDSKEATSKQQPTIPLPPRLLAHMRRWKRLGISNHSVIEFMGKRVRRIHNGWESLIEKAGLATDDKRQKILRHTLRHTAITWYLTPDRRTGKRVDIETVSLYCGVSVETIRKTYRHETPDTFSALLEVSKSS
jgi:integrase